MDGFPNCDIGWLVFDLERGPPEIIALHEGGKSSYSVPNSFASLRQIPI
jgi:hypothetical protein